MSPFERAAAACAALRSGGIVAVTDDPDREDEVDLIMAAEHATPQTVAYFLEHTSGYLCVAVPEDRAGALDLHPMRGGAGDRQGTAFLVTVDLHQGTTTGISARDRAATVRALADPDTRPADLDRPGHVVPLLARDGGVLERRGHTEAGVDLCRMAGLEPVALLCEVVTPDRVLKQSGLAHRRDHERATLRIASRPDIDTGHGDYRPLPAARSSRALANTGEASTRRKRPPTPRTQ